MFPAAARLSCSLSPSACCYSAYHNYWLPYLADLSPLDSDSFTSLFETGFVAMCNCRYLLMGWQQCLSVLLDKKFHAKRTCRKFFAVHPANANAHKGR